MLNHSDDRRARRSRRLLKQGLSELLREKKFSDISVRDITDRMDMNRGTFYLHYTDTYDLLHNLEEDVLKDAQEVIDEHREEIKGVNTLKPIFSPLLDYIVNHKNVCESLFGNNASSDFIGKLHQLIYCNGSELIRQRWLDTPKERIEYLMNFAAYGAIGLMRCWFKTNMNVSKEELLDMVDRLINGAAVQLLGEPQQL